MSEYYANDTDQTCYLKHEAHILKFELAISPQIYLLSFDIPLDLEESLNMIRLYQISNSDDLLSTNMSEMRFTLTKLTPSSYHLNFVSYTESNETRNLLLSFEQFNLDSSHTYMIIPSVVTASIVTDSRVQQAADVLGLSSQAVTISTAAVSFVLHLHQEGKTSQLMRILQIMARICFMKLINVNYLTPMAVFYKYTDLGQFGLPNVFKKMVDSAAKVDQATSSPNNGHRMLAASNNSKSQGVFRKNSEGNFIFNDHFAYSFSPNFLDNYGGIAFSACITLVLYILVKLISKCFKSENSKIKKILIVLIHSFERSTIMTLLVSRYMYLCSALILNYAAALLREIYQQIGFAFVIFYTSLLIYIFVLAICASCYHGKNRAKMKFIRPLLNLIILLCRDYSSKSFLGRLLTFWTLFSNFAIILVLELLSKWVIVQLSVLITLNLITIFMSIPKGVYKITANKVTVIGTEIGFIIISLVFLVMYLLESVVSGSYYHVRLGLSWTCVGVNLSIILFHIIVGIVEFFRKRKEKKREEEKQKQASQSTISEDTQMKFQNSHDFTTSVNLVSTRKSTRNENQSQKIQIRDINLK